MPLRVCAAFTRSSNTQITTLSGCNTSAESGQELGFVSKSASNAAAAVEQAIFLKANANPNESCRMWDLRFCHLLMPCMHSVPPNTTKKMRRAGSPDPAAQSVKQTACCCAARQQQWLHRRNSQPQAGSATKGS
jgi:hypothetical protein